MTSQNEDAVKTPVSTPEAAPAPDSRRALWGRIAAWFFWALGAVLLMPPNTFNPTQAIGEHFNLLDGTWLLTIPGQLKMGQIDGRDFIYTYGPLYQFSHALGVLVPPGDLGTLMRYHAVPEALILSAMFWSLLMYAGIPPAWRVPLYLSWIVGLNAPNFPFAGLKPFGGMWMVALCGRELLDNSNISPRRSWLRYLIWAGAAPVMMLYSCDSGLFTLAGAVLLGIVVWGATLRQRDSDATRLRGRNVRFLAAVLGGFAAFCLLLAILPGWGIFCGIM